MHFLVGLGGLDERADRRGRGVEDGALVALDHLPEAPGVRVGGHALEHDLRGAGGQRAIGDVGVAGDPADVSGAAEDVERIFDPFVQGGRRPSLKQQGSGIGLSIVRELISAQGGKVFLVDSGVGAHFRMELPNEQ